MLTRLQKFWCPVITQKERDSVTWVRIYFSPSQDKHRQWTYTSLPFSHRRWLKSAEDVHDVTYCWLFMDVDGQSTVLINNSLSVSQRSQALYSSNREGSVNFSQLYCLQCFGLLRIVLYSRSIFCSVNGIKLFTHRANGHGKHMICPHLYSETTCTLRELDNHTVCRFVLVRSVCPCICCCPS